MSLPNSLILSLLYLIANTACLAEVWIFEEGPSVEGELVGFYGPFVFLEKEDGNTSRMLFEKLDQDGKLRAQQWLVGHHRERMSGGTVEESESKLTQYLKKNLVSYSEGKLVPLDFASRKEPEFYAFYFSAHWCGPCRRFTPKLVTFYNAMRTLGYDDFELIFVSSDTDTGMMKKYMKEDKMPWPALKYGKRNSRLISRMEGNGIPTLVITDASGNILFHSYQNGKYIGPDIPRKMLRVFITASEKIRERLVASAPMNF